MPPTPLDISILILFPKVSKNKVGNLHLGSISCLLVEHACQSCSSDIVVPPKLSLPCPARKYTRAKKPHPDFQERFAIENRSLRTFSSPEIWQEGETISMALCRHTPHRVTVLVRPGQSGPPSSWLRSAPPLSLVRFFRSPRNSVGLEGGTGGHGSDPCKGLTTHRSRRW